MNSYLLIFLVVMMTGDVGSFQLKPTSYIRTISRTNQVNFVSNNLNSRRAWLPARPATNCLRLDSTLLPNSKSNVVLGSKVALLLLLIRFLPLANIPALSSLELELKRLPGLELVSRIWRKFSVSFLSQWGVFAKWFVKPVPLTDWTSMVVIEKVDVGNGFTKLVLVGDPVTIDIGQQVRPVYLHSLIY